MDVAHRLAETVVEEAVILARKQIAGSGRRGRKWFSPEGGLWFSVITKDRRKVKHNKIAGLLTAFAVQNVLEKFVEDVWVKWPNDIMVSTKKIAGVLVDVSYLGGEPKYVVIGVGVNINNTFEGTGLRDVATSLKELTGREYSLDKILTMMLGELSMQYRMFFEKPEYIKKEFAKKTKMVNRNVKVLTDEGVKGGVCVGIDVDGALVVESDCARFRIGDIGNVDKVKVLW